MVEIHQGPMGNKSSLVGQTNHFGFLYEVRRPYAYLEGDHSLLYSGPHAIQIPFEGQEQNANTEGYKIPNSCYTHGLTNTGKGKINEFLITSKIKIHYLPPYSPNLNPIERLWKVMREKKTYNKCYVKFIDFSESIRTFFFEEIPEMKEQLGKRINDNFQKITINHINCPST
jgi:DDE superfamily endonuclease